MGSEQGNADISRRRSVPQSSLRHRAGEALDGEGERGLTRIYPSPKSSAQTSAKQDEVANSKNISYVFYRARIILIDVPSKEVVQPLEEIRCFCLGGIFWKYLLFSVCLRQNNQSL